jgi:hypothetical protein
MGFTKEQLEVFARYSYESSEFIKTLEELLDTKDKLSEGRSFRDFAHLMIDIASLARDSVDIIREQAAMIELLVQIDVAYAGLVAQKSEKIELKEKKITDLPYSTWNI